MAQHSEPRANRELMQRVQIGVIGLGAVLLVVAFANIVVKSARPDPTQELTAGQTLTDTSKGNDGAQAGDTEPLADLGVAPKSDQAVGLSVPDLEPDPRLSKPMDKDPKKAGTEAP